MQTEMKYAFVVGLLILFTTGCATIRRVDSTQHNVTLLSEWAENPATWQETSKALGEGETVILKATQGEKVPLALRVELPVGTFEQRESFTFQQDTYFLLSETKSQKTFLVSPDGQRWASLYDMGALARLFDIKNMTWNFGFCGKCASTNGGAHMMMEMKVK